MKAVGKETALYIARRLHPEFVFNMEQLEGNPYTLPEVQTTLSGITVGGHKISDQTQVLNIAAGWSEIIRQVATNEFILSKENFIHINTLIAKDEALSVGAFRDGQSGLVVQITDRHARAKSWKSLFNHCYGIINKQQISHYKHFAFFSMLREHNFSMIAINVPDNS